MIASSKILLDQLTDVLAQLSTEDYSSQLDILNGASLGAHVRHTLEFYECLLLQKSSGVINYDLRSRDQNLETSPSQAITCIESLVARLENTGDNFALTLEFSYDTETNECDAVPTNFFRELSYLIEHTVHHMALMKIGLQALPKSIIIPESFGIATSTLRYRKSLPQQ